nr:unnamed protein product [Callosobruchus chinensis]
MDVDTEELVSCPYNSFHRIHKKRLGLHLYKCKKLHPNVNLAICDFNATHHVPEGELIHHHQHCPMEADDNWDESNVPTYNPEKYCMGHGVLRKLVVEPPSKKKEFRMQERERVKVVESPICDVVESCVQDETLEKENLARDAKRIAGLEELIRQHGISMNKTHKTGVESNDNYRNHNDLPYGAEMSCTKELQKCKKQDIIYNTPNKPAKSEDNGDRSVAKHNTDPPCNAKETYIKQIERHRDESVICEEIDKPAKKEDSEDRSAVLKDLIRRGLKMPFSKKNHS